MQSPEGTGGGRATAMNSHWRQHRPVTLSLPSHTLSERGYTLFPSPLTPAPTPSKYRRRPIYNTSSSSSITSLILLLISLQPLYSLLPLIQTAPSYLSLFPFAFIVSLLSFFVSIIFFSLFPLKSSTKTPLIFPLFPTPSIFSSLIFPLVAKSALLSVDLLLRFQSLRCCGTSPTILAELFGFLTAQFVSSGTHRHGQTHFIRGISPLVLAFLMLTSGWDRASCFPISGSTLRFSADCARIVPVLLSFLSGYLRWHERWSTNWSQLRQLGKRRVCVISLFFSTTFLFIPASWAFFAGAGDAVFIKDATWPLLNTVIFGVILSECYLEEKLFYSRDLEKYCCITFASTLILELLYFSEISLCGFFLCGILLWISVAELGSVEQTDLSSGKAETFLWPILNSFYHILNQRKSRKIALFLFLNTGYMVIEFITGFMSNSLGLISDACHMLFDCAALAIGLYASYISSLPANNDFNYGRGRFEVLSGYVNAVFLVLVGALIVLESFERMLEPQEVSAGSLLVVSFGGLLVNVVGLIFFHEEHHHSLGGVATCSHAHHSLDDYMHHHSSAPVDVNVHNCDRSARISITPFTSQGKSCGEYCHSHDDADRKQATTAGLKHTDSTHCSSHENCSRCHEHISQDTGDDMCPNIRNDCKNCFHNHHCNCDGQFHQFRMLTNSHTHKEDALADSTFQEARKQSPIDHNMEGIFLHVLADTMGSIGVIISSLLIKYKGWLIADPACSVFISVLIISSVVPLLRNSAEILLQRVPRVHEKDFKIALGNIMKIRGIRGVQSLHIWSLTNIDVVGTLHLHISPEMDKDSTKKRVSHVVCAAGITDLTIQVEHAMSR